jgi:hypothetical protein
VVNSLTIPDFEIHKCKIIALWEDCITGIIGW